TIAWSGDDTSGDDTSGDDTSDGMPSGSVVASADVAADDVPDGESVAAGPSDPSSSPQAIGSVATAPTATIDASLRRIVRFDPVRRLIARSIRHTYRGTPRARIPTARKTSLTRHPASQPVSAASVASSRAAPRLSPTVPSPMRFIT